jgi:sec-independent protein translocase protein TatA
MGNLGGTEIILIVFVVLLLFGGKKIPELMRGLGRGVREFKDAKDNVRRELEESINEPEKKSPGSTTTTTTTTPSAN